MFEIEKSLATEIRNKSREPWLHDPSLTDEERMYYKIKGVCHLCGIDPKFHKDDCAYSDVQLSFQQMEREHQMSIPMDTGYLARKLKYMKE